MQKLSAVCSVLCTSAVALFSSLALAQSGTASTATSSDKIPPLVCQSKTQKINEQRFVLIGGIKQWVTIKGNSCANPVILIVHGGPGNPLTPYAANMYADWENDFTLALWDQRGAGLTYGENKPAAGATLTLEQLSNDGVELAAYLTHYLGQKKLILMGGSWGSILGVYMVKAQPALFQAYIGTAQVVSYRDNQTATYTKLQALARATDDKATLTTLDTMGAPPWTNPRNFGIVRRILRKYEAKVSTPPPANWWVPAAAYTTPKILADFEESEEYSFVQFVGMNGDGMFSKVDLPKLGTQFDVPFFLVQGEEDLLSTPEIAQRYFDSITAPKKAFVLVPHAGHDPNQVTLDAQYKLLKESVAQSADLKK